MSSQKPDSTKRSIVLDLETLAIHPQAAITEIGIIDLISDERFSLLINPAEQLNEPSQKFVTSQDTMEFHLKRDPLYLVNLAHTGVRSSFAAGLLHNWLMERKAQTGQELVIWCQGTDFDIPIITNFLKHYQYHLPWRHDDVRDIRTVAKLFPGISYKKGNHSALEDASMEAQHLRKLAWGSSQLTEMLGLPT